MASFVGRHAATVTVRAAPAAAAAAFADLDRQIACHPELASADTILVPINPIERPGTPRSARDILDRVNEISFNAVALKEMKMLALLRKVADTGGGGPEAAAWARMRMHMVPNDVMLTLGASSKLNAEWDFLTMLRDEGRQAADRFLVMHGEDVGRRNTVDFDKLLQGV